VWDLVQLSADLLASSSWDRTVRIWNLTTNTCKFILTGHTLDVYGLKQITSSILARGSNDDTIKLWNITSGLLIRTLTGHTNAIGWSVDLLNNGQILVSGSWDKTIKLWNWSTGECLSTLQTTGSYLVSLAVINMNQHQQTTRNTPTSTSTMPSITSNVLLIKSD
jgi:WD40 repeat protein